MGIKNGGRTWGRATNDEKSYLQNLFRRLSRMPCCLLGIRVGRHALDGSTVNRIDSIQATQSPEPSAVVLLFLGGLWFVGRRPRSR
ncbi:MAG: hypothetical protein CBB70_12245 [Planctomycetaceae bacterium TMED10]|nr:MAG: hypothetical protein CBB70_12245 [Planctomycetaceae bacterium TMED10]